MIAEQIASALKDLLAKVTDPSFIVGLGPQSGLQVTPVTFQSVEQEGRWKPASLVNTGRNLEVTGHAEDPSKPPKRPQLKEPYGKIQMASCPLFSLEMPCIQKYLKIAVAAEFPHLAPFLASAADKSTLTIDATWWYDGLEIYAGYAGLRGATGFGSVWDTMASVSLQATPFGNYYPAATMLTWSGWVNPIGPNYWEFRGGLLVNADGTCSGNADQAANLLRSVPILSALASQGNDYPSYMSVWGRDPKQGLNVQSWNDKAGFRLVGGLT